MGAIYVQPVFNLPCSIFRNGVVPPAPPAVIALGNLSPGRLVSGTNYDNFFGSLTVGQMYLRLPAGTDIRDAKAPAGPDNVEVPSGSGRLYNVIFVDEMGGGFANEHRMAMLGNIHTWPVPFPSAGGGTPPPPPGPGWGMLVKSGSAGPVHDMNLVANFQAGHFYVLVGEVNGGLPGLSGTVDGDPLTTTIFNMNSGFVNFGIDQARSRIFRGTAVGGVSIVNLTFPPMVTGNILAFVFQYTPIPTATRGGMADSSPSMVEGPGAWLPDAQAVVGYLACALSNFPVPGTQNAWDTFTDQGLVNSATASQNFSLHAGKFVSSMPGTYAAIKSAGVPAGWCVSEVSC